MTAARNSRPPVAFRLDAASGVPVYRQLIDQVTAGLASRALVAGDQLPTVRQLAVDLSINPNTVMRAYRELEIRGLIDTQQGTGTFISARRPRNSDAERQRQLSQMVSEWIARAGAAGFSVEEVLEQIHDQTTNERNRR